MWLAVLLAILTPLAQERSQRAPAEDPFRQGMAAERAGDLQAALTSYERAVERDPAHAQAHDRLGFVLGRLGRTAEALTHFERAVAIAPTLFDAQYHLGATRWWTKDLQGAK